MTKFWRTHRILMIFLLVSLVMPLNQLRAQAAGNNNQNDETAYYEEQLLMNLETSQAYDFEENSNTRDVPNEYYQTDPFTFQGTGNYIRLNMSGSGNDATALQQYGKGNVMDLNIEGEDNVGRYLQEGSHNYIIDGITGNDIYREINQYGNQLGIYNQGMQSIPMIINQKGEGMKITITGPQL